MCIYYILVPCYQTTVICWYICISFENTRLSRLSKTLAMQIMLCASYYFSCPRPPPQADVSVFVPASEDILNHDHHRGCQRLPGQRAQGQRAAEAAFIMRFDCRSERVGRVIVCAGRQRPQWTADHRQNVRRRELRLLTLQLAVREIQALHMVNFLYFASSFYEDKVQYRVILILVVFLRYFLLNNIKMHLDEMTLAMYRLQRNNRTRTRWNLDYTRVHQAHVSFVLKIAIT